jgi:hypothetical protein
MKKRPSIQNVSVTDWIHSHGIAIKAPVRTEMQLIVPNVIP